MIPVGKIKKDLEYSGNLKEVIDILKLTSSSEFSRISAMAPQEDVLEKYIIDSLGMLKDSGVGNPFFTENTNLPRCYILICSDEGFLGEMNNRVINAAVSHSAGKNKKVIVLGERGAELLKEDGVTAEVFPAVSSEVKTADVMNLTNHIFAAHRKGEIGSVYVVYMHFNSFTSHKTEAVKLLPCDEILKHVGSRQEGEDTIIEPNVEEVMGYLVKMWIENNIYNACWSSKLAEWATRIMRLESSSDELDDMTKALRFKYFKSVHELSDKVIREIFATKTIGWEE